MSNKFYSRLTFNLSWREHLVIVTDNPDATGVVLILQVGITALNTYV